MKRINYYKLILDLLMGITFALLFRKQVFGGLTFHETAGTIIGVAFLTHILLNWRWVKNITLQLFDRKLPGVVRFGYILNVLLFISMTTIIVSGVLISRILFPGMHIGNQSWFKVTHISLSFVTLIMVGVHIGLHWKWVMNVVKKIIPMLKSIPFGGHLAKVLAVLILMFGIYEMYQTNFIDRVENSRRIFNLNAQAGGDHRMSAGQGNGQQRGEQQNAQIEGRGDDDRGQAQGTAGKQGNGARGKGRGGSANPFVVFATYFGMIAVFIFVIYYLEKAFGGRKKKPMSKTQPASSKARTIDSR